MARKDATTRPVPSVTCMSRPGTRPGPPDRPRPIDHRLHLVIIDRKLHRLLVARHGRNRDVLANSLPFVVSKPRSRCGASPAGDGADAAEAGEHQEIGLWLRHDQNLPANLSGGELGGVEVHVGQAGQDSPTVSFRAASSGLRMSVQGRVRLFELASRSPRPPVEPVQQGAALPELEHQTARGTCGAFADRLKRLCGGQQALGLRARDFHWPFLSASAPHFEFASSTCSFPALPVGVWLSRRPDAARAHPGAEAEAGPAVRCQTLRHTRAVET